MAEDNKDNEIEVQDIQKDDAQKAKNKGGLFGDPIIEI